MSQAKTSQIESHILQRFTVVKKVGSGAYGHVWKVQQKSSQKTYALKKIFDAFQHSTDAQRTFRQIQILQQTNHSNIVKLYETMAADNGKDVYLLFEFMESDLHNAIGDNIMKDAHFKYIVYQIAKSLKYLHSGKIIHRDLKPSNVLVNSNCKIKLCDFGLVRSLSHLQKAGPVLTQGVATRWYRAPEVLLGSKSYSTPADVWSFGCIVYQMLMRKPLFAGSSTLDQLQKIVQFTGMPSDSDINSLESDMCKTMLKQIKTPLSKSQSLSMIKGIPQEFLDLLTRMLAFNPKKRITMEQILKHPLVKPFRKQEEEISSPKVLTMSIDDNMKLSVEEYRKLIYKGNRVSEQRIGSPRNLTTSTSSRHLNKQISLKCQDSYVSSKGTSDGNGLDQALKKMKSCKDIYETMQKNSNTNIHINTSSKNIQSKDSITNSSIKNLGSQISWKQLAKSPSQALRLSGKIIVKKIVEESEGNDKAKAERNNKTQGTSQKDIQSPTLSKNQNSQKRKDQEKTQIQRSELPNVSDICDNKFIPKKNFYSPKVQLSKKSISSFTDVFANSHHNCNVVKKNSDNVVMFSPKNGHVSPKNSPNNSPVRNIFSPFKNQRK